MFILTDCGQLVLSLLHTIPHTQIKLSPLGWSPIKSWIKVLAERLIISKDGEFLSEIKNILDAAIDLYIFPSSSDLKV